ncbi:hypothetical protein [Agromyces sp. NPDC058064]|uniref:hypothetical protein n=1 Tax=Agromyces sp. NPDC058064 TaxID=3346322 RepID=UPI0036D787C2
MVAGPFAAARRDGRPRGEHDAGEGHGMAMSRRARGRLVAALVWVGGWALALAFVRISLDWSDAQPYEGETTELRYVVLATIAGSVMIGSAVTAVVVWWRAGRASRGRGREGG